jgi:hypothetical protein
MENFDKHPFGRSRRRLEDNIKMDVFRELRCEDVRWMELPPDSIEGEGNGKVVLCLIKHHTMKIHWGSGGIAPHIFNLGSK